MESISRGLSCNSIECGSHGIEAFVQLERPSINNADINKVIPFRQIAHRRIYTRKGDLGRCSLLFGERIMKDADQMEASGDIDELNSELGLLVSLLPKNVSWISSEIIRIQASLLQIGALIATDPNMPLPKRLRPISREQIRLLEMSIDCMEEKLPEIRSFIIPGGHISASQANVARSVCRRAERHIVKHLKKNKLAKLPEAMKNVLAFLNRLSDYLFEVGRYCNLLLNSIENKEG